MFSGTIKYLHVEQLDQDQKIGLSYLRIKSNKKQHVYYLMSNLQKLFMVMSVLLYDRIKILFSF